MKKNEYDIILEFIYNHKELWKYLDQRDQFRKSIGDYNEVNLFSEVQQEFQAIAGIVEMSGTWEEV